MSDRFEPPVEGTDEIDPELQDDLGPELELRGDVMDDELQAARAEADECRELALRLKAELENYRKRVQRDQADAVKRAGERIVADLLPVLDNLERAIDHTTAGSDPEHLLGGVEAVQRQFLDVLGKEGVESIDPFGQQFDPHLHQAVGQREDADVPDQTVVDVYQKGYQMHGRVVRPAMVIVATGGPPAPKE